MKLTRQDGEWPTIIAPIGAAVCRTSIDRKDGELRVALEHPETHWNREITIPAPWVFTSCLLSLSSDHFIGDTPELEPASGLIGLEGANLSAIERDEKRIELVFGSIRIQVSVD